MVTNTKRRTNKRKRQKKNIRKTSKSLVGGLSLFKKKSEKALQKKVKVINLHDLKTLVFSNKDILDNLMKTLKSNGIISSNKQIKYTINLGHLLRNNTIQNISSKSDKGYVKLWVKRSNTDSNPATISLEKLDGDYFPVLTTLKSIEDGKIVEAIKNVSESSGIESKIKDELKKILGECKGTPNNELLCKIKGIFDSVGLEPDSIPSSKKSVKFADTDSTKYYESTKELIRKHKQKIKDIEQNQIELTQKIKSSTEKLRSKMSSKKLPNEQVIIEIKPIKKLRSEYDKKQKSKEQYEELLNKLEKSIENIDKAKLIEETIEALKQNNKTGKDKLEELNRRRSEIKETNVKSEPTIPDKVSLTRVAVEGLDKEPKLETELESKPELELSEEIKNTGDDVLSAEDYVDGSDPWEKVGGRKQRKTRIKKSRKIIKKSIKKKRKSRKKTNHKH